MARVHEFMAETWMDHGDPDEQRIKGTKCINRWWSGGTAMSESFGYKLNSKGIPENFERVLVQLGTASGQLYVDREYVTERTSKGYVADSELVNGFEAAERHFSDNPTENEYVYDSFKFHTYNEGANIIYCLPFGCVYYKELDHE